VAPFKYLIERMLKSGSELIPVEMYLITDSLRFACCISSFLPYYFALKGWFIVGFRYLDKGIVSILAFSVAHFLVFEGL